MAKKETIYMYKMWNDKERNNSKENFCKEGYGICQEDYDPESSRQESSRQES